ncbi:hypothetical protein BDZ94DRAFT_1301777 [Collybia nuda]|uniref:BTB domain-containing protein n=1 Tax=Collybia nuda TaxID=64659 RepID=A0A9P6CE25_9AGAR|nr:hypothetical protein BDZ94DRAFT_1301777 [Collybia nuda]
MWIFLLSKGAMTTMSNSMFHTMENTPPSPVQANLRSSDRCDADVIFQSVDGVLFLIHRKYLEANTEGFPPACFDTQNEFVYPARLPYLDSIPFETLAPLAEAAEKYQVYSAMNMCRVRMTDILPKHSEAVMGYAVKHNYTEIMGSAAPLLLDRPLEEILENLPYNLIKPWELDCLHRICFLQKNTVYEQNLTQSAPRRPGIPSTNVCQACNRTPDTASIQIFGKFLTGTAALKNLDNTFDPSFICCDNMKPDFAAWRSAVEAKIQRIPNFTTFLHT